MKRTRNDGSGGGAENHAALQPLGKQSSAGALDLHDGEEIKMQQPETKLVVGNDSVGSGVLFVTTERVAWLQTLTVGEGGSASNVTTGYSIAYPAISLHAICRDTESFPEACIFCQLDSGSDDMDEEDLETPEGVAAAAAAGAVGATTVAAIAKASEIRLVPANPAGLEALFEAMSACAQLHPDEMDEDDENGGGSMSGLFGLLSGGGAGGGGFYTASGFISGSADGVDDSDAGGQQQPAFNAEAMAQLDRFDSMLEGADAGGDDEQFADADAEAQGGDAS